MKISILQSGALLSEQGAEKLVRATVGRGSRLETVRGNVGGGCYGECVVWQRACGEKRRRFLEVRDDEHLLKNSGINQSDEVCVMQHLVVTIVPSDFFQRLGLFNANTSLLRLPEP